MATEGWCDEHQVSEHTGIPVATLRRWRRKGAEKVLPFHKIGSLVRYRLSEVDQAIEARRVNVAA